MYVRLSGYVYRIVLWEEHTIEAPGNTVDFWVIFYRTLLFFIYLKIWGKKVGFSIPWDLQCQVFILNLSMERIEKTNRTFFLVIEFLPFMNVHYAYLYSLTIRCDEKWKSCVKFESTWKTIQSKLSKLSYILLLVWIKEIYVPEILNVHINEI